MREEVAPIIIQFWSKDLEVVNEIIPFKNSCGINSKIVSSEVKVDLLDQDAIDSSLVSWITVDTLGQIVKRRQIILEQKFRVFEFYLFENTLFIHGFFIEENQYIPSLLKYSESGELIGTFILSNDIHHLSKAKDSFVCVNQRNGKVLLYDSDFNLLSEYKNIRNILTIQGNKIYTRDDDKIVVYEVE